MSELFAGNAEAEWKAVWRVRKQWRSPRWWMLHCRREAALERKLAAAQRTIDALQDLVWQLEAQEHNREDGNEWEKEYYLRGMHR